MTKQFTKEEAIEFHDSKEWLSWTAPEVFKFQMEQRIVCIPWGHVRKCAEEALGRPVYTHEFLDSKSLVDELEGRVDKKTKHPLTDCIEIVEAATGRKCEVQDPIYMDK